eukprot:m.386856 g.386856  ORF g.386856 m.386856 type:complete len:63 (+) comp21025_c0_seq5:339-527(+)
MLTVRQHKFRGSWPSAVYTRDAILSAVVDCMRTANASNTARIRYSTRVWYDVLTRNIHTMQS